MAQTRMAVCLTDPSKPDNPIVFANRAFYRLTGYPPEEVLGHNCRFLQGPETDPASLERIREALREEEVCVTEILNYRKDGSPFWNALHLGPIYNEDSSIRYFFGSQWNVTEVHAARAAEQHALMLRRELSHRVKNMFSVISGIVTLTARHEKASWVANKINERVRALGRAYEATLHEPDEGRASLRDVARLVLDPYAPRDGDRISLDGPSIELDPNVVSVLAIALHELATNASKYGALSGSDGQVRVGWHRVEGGRIMEFIWREEGGPALAGPPRKTGMGLEIMASLLAGSKGSIEYGWHAHGLTAALRLPMATDE